MAELYKIRFLLFFALMIFPAHALDVIISGAHQDFKQRSEIKINMMNGQKVYAGTSSPLCYEAGVNISKVIVYIMDRSRYVEIIRNAVRGTRSQIADELKLLNWELVFLGIENFDDDEHHLIGAFMLEKIQRHRNQREQDLTIKIIGENRFDRSYECFLLVMERYQENVLICGGTLIARLRDIPRGALRPAGTNKKEFKLRGFVPKVKEVTWSVRIINNTYVPAVNVSNWKYNFRIKHLNRKICVLVLGGKEYTKATSLDSRPHDKERVRAIQEKMLKNDEFLFILGAFNFDWTEVYLVTQFILKHTQGGPSSSYNVFACGFGMFNTHYLNWYEKDGRHIRQPQNSNLLDIVRASMGAEVKERKINMHYSENGWQISDIPIGSENGQYAAVDGYDFTFPWLNQRIAFIVYGSNEVNGPIDYQTVFQSVEELERSNIYVVLIEAINFESYDIHIIAEWIELHKGQINPEQIAVLGAGMFDTIFQSQCTTYNTFFDVGKNEMRTIRNAFVRRGNEKSVHVAKIDDSDKNFETWSYPMNTIVNGFYESDLIPDMHMFDTTGGIKILFIITSAYNFHQISAISRVESISKWFRVEIKKQYPLSDWSIFLVGLDNFGPRDSDRFAELVKMQTHDARPLPEFVRVFNYGIGHALYRYKDTESFIIYTQIRMQERFGYFFGSRCNLQLRSTDD